MYGKREENPETQQRAALMDAQRKPQERNSPLDIIR